MGYNHKYFTEEEKKEGKRASNRKYQAKYRIRNPNSEKEWRLNNKDKKRKNQREWEKRKRKTDILFKLSQDARNLINSTFKRKNIIKPRKTEVLLGCSFEKFISYILSQCPENTTVKDFGRFGYHIDHIIPLSSAKTEEELVKLCHYTNLQPLWWKDNLLKSNKIQQDVILL